MVNKINFNYNRNFTFLLYPNEDESHKKALEIIKSKYKHAYIIHDKDKEENGNPKKEHVHCVVHFENARYKKALAKELGIGETYLDGCLLKEQLMYLIHFENPEKYQYDLEDVKGNLKNKLEAIWNNNKGIDMNIQINEIIKGIMKANIKNTYDLMNWACENNCINVILKNSYIFLKLIKDYK